MTLNLFHGLLLIMSIACRIVKSQIQNCLELNTTLDSLGMQTCKLCTSNTALTISGYQCLPCTSPCSSCYGLSTLCLTCISSYRLDNKTHTCVACPTGALNCTESAILSCLPSFYYSNSSMSCLYCPENCLECNSSNTCNRCATEFVKQAVRGNVICAVNDQQILKLMTFFSLFGMTLLLFILLCCSALYRYQKTKNHADLQIEEHNETLLNNIMKQIELQQGMAKLVHKYKSPSPRK
jgi:hypothetical protein